MRQGIHGIGVRLGRRATVRSLLIVSLRTLDGRVFGEPDAFAWVQGWQIDRGRLLRRTYRDARFAFLLECGLCHGEGTAALRAASHAASHPAPRAGDAGGGVAGGAAGTAHTARGGVGAGTKTGTGTGTGTGMNTGAGTRCPLCDGTGRLDRLRPEERP